MVVKHDATRAAIQAEIVRADTADDDTLAADAHARLRAIEAALTAAGLSR